MMIGSKIPNFDLSQMPRLTWEWSMIVMHAWADGHRTAIIKHCDRELMEERSHKHFTLLIRI